MQLVVFLIDFLLFDCCKVNGIASKLIFWLMLVTVSFTFLGNKIWYNIKTANFVFNMATECKEEIDKNLSLFSERMNRSDLNIHWNYVIQNV